MSKTVSPAASHWEVECHSCGQVFRPYYVVILRNRQKTDKSVIKATSSDSESVCRCIDQLNQDLCELTNEEFVAKHQLKRAA